MFCGGISLGQKSLTQLQSAALVDLSRSRAQGRSQRELLGHIMCATAFFLSCRSFFVCLFFFMSRKSIIPGVIKFGVSY